MSQLRAPDGSIDLAWAAELGVIEQLLQHPSGLHRLAPPDAVIRVGDGETEYGVFDDRGQGRFQECQRGAVKQTLQTASVLLALRHLVHRVAATTRPGWWPLAMKPFDTPLEDPNRVSPEEVAASYLHLTGVPLFRLDAGRPPDAVRTVVPLDEPYQQYLTPVSRPSPGPLELPDGRDAVLDGLLGELRLLQWEPEAGGVLEVGNDERAHLLLRDKVGSYRLDTVDRCLRGTVGRFSDQAAAYAYLVLILAEAVRARRGWPPVQHRRLAPRAELTDGVDHRRLTWPGGWANLAPGWLGEQHAHRFSWAAQVRPAEIVESYGHRNGKPLFDLGLTAVRPEPPAVEAPPSDTAAATETEAVLAAVAEIEWVAWPMGLGDVLVVAAQSGTGRAITFRHGMFQYQSVVGDWRKIQATFATAGAARRFLVLEASTITRSRSRSRRRQPVLRVRRPAPEWTVTKEPTEFVVSGVGLTATFPLGPIGQQSALTFTWCGAASLGEIAASFRDPGGAPLFPQ